MEYIKKWLYDIWIKLCELIYFGLHLVNTFAASHLNALNEFADCSWATFVIDAFPLAMITLIQATIAVKYQLMNLVTLDELAYFFLLCVRVT